MGAATSTPLDGDAPPSDTAEYLMETFVGEKSFPLTSDFWQKLLESPLYLRWQPHRVLEACQHFSRNNYSTRHLAKVLIHLAWCLQESTSASDTLPIVYGRAVNAVYISSVFLKYLIEDYRSDNIEGLHLSFHENEPLPEGFSRDIDVKNLFMRSVLSFIASVDVSPKTYILHQELLSLVLITMSTQLLSGPSSGPQDVNPFIDAAMAQEPYLVNLVVRKLLFNYISRLRMPLNSASYSIFFEGNQTGVLQRVGSAAANLMLSPFNYLVSSSGGSSISPLGDTSLHVLLILVHFRKCALRDYQVTNGSDISATSESFSREGTYLSVNPYSKALDNAKDIEFDRVDIEGNAYNVPLLTLPFSLLFDSLGRCLADEMAVLLLYSLVHGNPAFLEYVFVRTDIDSLLMPIMETLYNGPRKTSNQIYMLLIILLIISQDSSFNASLHKQIVPNVSWYKERRLHQTSVGSLMVVVLIRTVKFNLSKLRNVYLHTTCLATLANMAPHVHRLSAYASQRLVSLFDMLSQKYNKVAEHIDSKMHMTKTSLTEGDSLAEYMSTDLHLYTDFLRIVLEIINAILTYALPRNPEVVYAIMHRQEVFQPFRNHPRFSELLENIFTVLDFFNSRMDAHKVDGEWSVEKVLQVIIINCRSWRGEGMKMFTPLHFAYEQESHPEEFFIPYVWQLVLSRCGFRFNPRVINLFPANVPVQNDDDGAEDASWHKSGEVPLDP